MSLLRMMEERLPPGFRFHPRDEELVCDYLEKKVSASNSNNINGSYHGCSFHMLIDVDLNKCEPWDLPEMACVGGKEWYFFNLRDRKYSTGQRTNRATQSGYWKATGKDRLITKKQRLVGMRKTLVFYHGRAPRGKKTDWVMHEFRMETNYTLSNATSKEDWVLCRVSFKSRSTAPKQLPAAAAKPFLKYGSSSYSLPPLVHSNLNFEHEVQCFSIPLAGQTATIARQPLLPSLPVGHLAGQSADDMARDPMSRKMIKAVLSQLSTKLEGERKREVCSMSFADGVAGNYLSTEAAAGLQNLW